MFKFSVKKKGDDRWDDNPAEEEMRLGVNKVREAAESGKLSKAKAAYAWDEHDNIVKIVVVFDSKEYDAAKDYLEEDHMQTEPLRPVGNANKLLDDIYKIMQIAMKSKEEINMEEKRTEEQMVVEEAVATTSEASTSEVVEEAVATAPVNEVTAPVAEGVVTGELVTGYGLTDVEETEPVTAETGEGHKGMRITGIASGLDTEAIIADLVNLKQELKSKLKAQYTNTEFITSSVVRLTVDDGKKPYLTLSLKKDKKSGDRVYHLDEIIAGVAQCQNSTKADFTAAVLRKQGVALEDFIINRQGDYSKEVNDILSVLQCIEQNRLLEVNFNKCLNHEVLSAEEFMERFQKFLLSNPFDERIAYIKGGQSILLGVVGRGNYTAYQNFKRLVAELAPENDAKRLKDNLFAKECFETDSNNACKDCQKTLSEDLRKNTDIRGDKIYAFKFKEEFMHKFEQKYDEVTKLAEQEEQEGKTKQETNQKGGKEHAIV